MWGVFAAGFATGVIAAAIGFVLLAMRAGRTP
jgi:hypothetical protein